MTAESERVALALHDRATRGATLASHEQTQLEQWYAAQDIAEQVALGSGTISTASQDVQSQVTAVLDRCILLAQRIQELSNHNDDLRQDIAQLRQQVARRLQPA